MKSTHNCNLLTMVITFALLPLATLAVEPPTTENGAFVEDLLIVKLGPTVTYEAPVPNLIHPFDYLEMIGVDYNISDKDQDRLQIMPSIELSIATIYQKLQNPGAFTFNPPFEWVSLNWRLFLPIQGPPYIANRVWNFSVRAEVAAGEKVAIGGLSIPGPHSKVVVIRAKGPSLVNVGIKDALPDPHIELYRDNSDQIPPNVRLASPHFKILENDDWDAQAIGYMELTSILGIRQELDDPRESLIATLLDPGLYTTHVSSSDGNGSGVALLEYFLLDSIEFKSAESE